MKLKRIYTLFLLLFSLSLTVSFQSSAQGHNGAEIRKLRVEYVLSKVKLDTGQKAKFERLYGQYMKEVGGIRHEMRELRNEKSKEALQRREDLEKQRLNIKSKYNKQFLEFMSAEQVVDVEKAEKEFNQMLRDRLRKERSRK